MSNFKKVLEKAKGPKDFSFGGGLSTPVLERDNGDLAKSISFFSPELSTGWKVESAEVKNDSLLIILVKEKK